MFKDFYMSEVLPLVRWEYARRRAGVSGGTLWSLQRIDGWAQILQRSTEFHGNEMKQPLVGGLEQEIYFSIYIYIGKNHPNWLIFFRGVETTNQTTVPSRCFPTRGSNHLIDSLICGWIAWEKRSSRYCGSWFSFLWAGKSFWNPGSPVNPHACHAQPFLPMGMSNEKTKVVMVYYWAYLRNTFAHCCCYAVIPVFLLSKAMLDDVRYLYKS